MTRFKEALLADLTERIAHQPALARPRRRRWQLAAVGAAALTVAVSAAVLFTPSQQRPAYAVEVKPDGTIKLSLHDLRDLRDIEGTNRALRKAGARAVLMVPAATGGCRHKLPTRRTAEPFPHVKVRAVNELRGDGDWLVEIAPGIPAGKTMLIMPRDTGRNGKHSPRGPRLDMELVSNPVPPCVEDRWPVWPSSVGPNTPPRR